MPKAWKLAGMKENNFQDKINFHRESSEYGYFMEPHMTVSTQYNEIKSDDVYMLSYALEFETTQ